MRIWKWTLTAADRQTLMLPTGAQLLTVQMQHGRPQVWALCDDAQDVWKVEPRTIAIYGTGNPMPERPGKYLSTFQVDDGALVFHAFELDV